MEKPIESWTVAELKAELKQFGASTSGRKAQLLERLTNLLSSIASRRTGPKSFHNQQVRAQELKRSALDASGGSPAKRRKTTKSASSPRRQRKRSSPKKASKSRRTKKGRSPVSAGDLEADIAEINALKRHELLELEQSGITGKEGSTFIKTASSGNQYAIKLFKKSKANSTLKREADLQAEAGKHGLCPRVFSTNLKEKFIVMERMGR
jgi:hypothetical protein